MPRIVLKHNVVVLWCKPECIYSLKSNLEFNVTTLQLQNKTLNIILKNRGLNNEENKPFQWKKDAQNNNT